MPKKLTQEEYINKATSIHGNKYDYSKTVYTKAHDKITITCPYHGDFTQKACSHTNAKQGCPKCSGNVPYTNDEFIEKASEIHSNFYTYEKLNYTSAHSEVTITCPIHGDFDQLPYVHLQGHNCPECAKETVSRKATLRPDLWSYRGWESAGNSSLEFENFSLYVIRCWDEKEEFLKIGKTFTNMSRRFRGNIPYEWELLVQKIGSANYISELEQQMHNQYKNDKYIPLKPFNGCKECYQITLKDKIDVIDTRTTTNS